MNEGEDSTNLPNMYTTQVVVSGVDEMDLSDACMHRRLGLAERERAFSALLRSQRFVLHDLKHV